MPSRKRLGKVSYPSKSDSATGKTGGARPSVQHNDSLRADIEAARAAISSPESGRASAAGTASGSAASIDTHATLVQGSELSTAGGDEDDGDDIADALLAALDARDAADDQVVKATAAVDGTAHVGLSKRSLLNGGIKKKSKAQAKKEKRAAEEEAMRVQAREEFKANGGQPDLAEVERRGIGELCQVLNAEMYEINPDGHCLYAAVADQLGVRKNQPTDFKSARFAAAAYMRAHPDDFIPFITDEDVVTGAKEEVGSSDTSGSPQEHFAKYCTAIEETGVWGGQPEILALSHAYEVPVHVVQVGLPTLKIGEEAYASSSKTPLVISYHRHMYGLGEHYNSLRPRE
ncbi:hypothetical protein V8E36_004690 [Tilletia maclaganii]